MLAILTLAGCTSSGSNAHWWSPGTWFSRSEAVAVDKAKVKVEDAKVKVEGSEDKATHSATIEIFKASLSGQNLPASPSKDITLRFLSDGLGLLQQVSPLSAVESSQSLKIVQGFYSDQVELRKFAESKQQEAEGRLGVVSNELSKTKSDLESANKKFADKDMLLRSAFDRENALANELRNQRAFFWIASGVAILGVLGWFYARFMLGGIPGALGGALARIRAQNGPAADLLTSHLDSFLNRHEQSTVFKAYAKASTPQHNDRT